MPFGKKPDPAGGPGIDFDAIYDRGLQPGIEDAGMSPIRADEEKLGGVIHTQMFERLLLCDFAVADLTTENPNVLYELGIRHAARPRTTLTVYAAKKPLPFDVKPLRTQPYELTDSNELTPEAAERLRLAVTEHLTTLRELARRQDVTDSPLFQSIPAWRPAPLAAEAASTFREQVQAGEALKRRLERVRRMAGSKGTAAQARADLAEIHGTVRAGDSADLGVHTGLMLAYRALNDWSGMISTYAEMPAPLQRQVEVRRLLAFAHNRQAEDQNRPDREEERQAALDLLNDIEDEQGPSSETYGLRGRVYKSHWLELFEAGDEYQAPLLLERAVNEYVRGFETDWRDYYPGVNAVTLLDVQGTADSLAKKDELLPVVRFALEQRAQTESADYWVAATRLELAVLDHDPAAATRALGEALLNRPEAWQGTTTADNLSIIRQARAGRGADVTWLDGLITALSPPGPQQ
jgi:hypothetical protein